MPPTDPDQLVHDIGRRIADLRVQNGWTQAEMADEADVSVKYLQRVEAGNENLTLRSLAAIANTLDVPVIDLFAAPSGREVRRGRPPVTSG